MTELVTNGTFTTDLTGWTSTGGTVVQSAGVMVRTPAGTFNGSYQDVPVVANAVYVLTATLTHTATLTRCIAYNNNNFTTSLGFLDTTTGATGMTLTTPNTFIRLYCYSEGASGNSNFDNISLIRVPSWQATGTGAESITTIAPAWPSHVADDIGLLITESCGGEPTTLTTPAGFVAVTGSPSSTGATTSGTSLGVYWCRATSGAMSAPTVADPGNHVWGQIITFRHCATSGDPWDVTAAAQKAGATTAASAPSVTTTIANTLIVNAIARDNDSAVAAFSVWTNSALLSLTEVTGSDLGTALGNGGGFALATGVKVAAGATGATTATVTSSINASLTIALKIPSTATASILRQMMSHHG